MLATSLLRRRIIHDFGFRKLVLSASWGQIGSVVSLVFARLRAAVTGAVGRAKSALREASRPYSDYGVA